jgi:hypothetical protein
MNDEDKGKYCAYKNKCSYGCFQAGRRHRFLTFLLQSTITTSMKTTTKHTAPINPVEKTKVEADPKAAPENEHDKELDRRKKTGVTIDPKTQKP